MLKVFTPTYERIALNRLAVNRLTVGQAMNMPDEVLLRIPGVGRITLRYVRAFQGPRLPLPVPFIGFDPDR